MLTYSAKATTNEMTRNSLELKEAAQRINAQWQLNEKRLLADQVINNSEAEADWILQVSALLKSTIHNINSQTPIQSPKNQQKAGRANRKIFSNRNILTSILEHQYNTD